MAKEKNGTNWGCFVLVAIFVIINLVTLFSSENRENVEGFGTLILGFAVIAGIVWLIKLFGSNESDSSNSDDKKH